MSRTCMRAKCHWGRISEGIKVKIIKVMIAKVVVIFESDIN